MRLSSCVNSIISQQSFKHKIFFYLCLTIFVQGVLLIGYQLLENAHVVADKIDNIANYISENPSNASGQTSGNDTRELATFISLVRNEELDSLLPSIRMVEETFNHRYGYPWTFFNDDDFSEEFKKEVNEAVSSKAQFVKIDSKDWSMPDWIDKDRAKKAGQSLKENGVRYGDKESYHKMCRWNSGKFYENPIMKNYKYYWRVEPGTKYFCKLDYDVFKFMQQKDLDYGFVINIYDHPLTVKTLWNATLDFFSDHPEYMHNNNAYNWLTQDSRKADMNDVTGGYSTCHFWSNFEIGSLDFFQSEKYKKYFDHLDRAGGFFYERWGDAPVHSVALGMMADRNKIHYFDDIGYFHYPYYNCPKSDKCKECKPGKFSQDDNLDHQNCLAQWKRVAGSKNK